MIPDSLEFLMKCHKSRLLNSNDKKDFFKKKEQPIKTRDKTAVVLWRLSLKWI